MRAAVSVMCSLGLTTGLISLCALVSVAQQKKEVSYHVGPKAVISITNNYGPIKIKPSRAGEVLITMISRSKDVSFENEHHGNRIQLRSVSPVQGANLAELTVLVPGDACVTLQSSNGVLRAEGLEGDLIFETTTGAVEVNNIREGHIHVHTLSGPTILSGIHNSHLDVNSVSGNTNLRDITGSSAVIHSGTGRIVFDGDRGSAGAYRITTHAGDIEVSIPASSAVDISSMSAQSRPEAAVIESGPNTGKKSLLAKSQISRSSVFVLRSFRGKIRVQRP
jgi:DUF4097 and DUF4098 domain-containing protein YvlB